MANSYLRLQKVARKSCENKQGYESRREACDMAERLRQQNGYPLYTYRCSACRLWHLTRREQLSDL